MNFNLVAKGQHNQNNFVIVTKHNCYNERLKVYMIEQISYGRLHFE